MPRPWTGLLALALTTGCSGGTADTEALTSQVAELSSRLQANEEQLAAALTRIEGLEVQLEATQALVDAVQAEIVPGLVDVVEVTTEE